MKMIEGYVTVQKQAECGMTWPPTTTTSPISFPKRYFFKRRDSHARRFFPLQVQKCNINRNGDKNGTIQACGVWVKDAGR